MTILLLYLICGVVAFVYTSREFGKKNWPLLYTFLYRRSIGFWIPGLAYVILAVLVFYFFSNKISLHTPLLNQLQEGFIKSCLVAVVCGVSVRAALSINFWEKYTEDKKIKTVGLDLAKKYIEDYSIEIVEPGIPRHLNTYIDKCTNKIQGKYDLPKLKIELGHYIRLSLNSLNQLKQTSLINDINKTQDLKELAFCIIDNWGIKYYANFIKYIKGKI